MMVPWLKNLFSKEKSDGFFFIHIPKTAGTSFITILDACVDEREIFPCQLWHEINSEVVAKKDQYRLLRGHFGGGSYKLLAAKNVQRLTILRHPQSLSISTYHFIKREKNTAVHDLVTSQEMQLKDFLEEPVTAHKINNRMVRHLSFDLQQDPEAQELFLSKQSIEVISKWIKAPNSITNKQRLIRAKRAINHCAWFGIQEEFDKSMQLFSYVFKRPPLGTSPKLNAYKPNQEIDDYCKGLIAKQNKYDLELYAYAKNIFSKKYQDMCNDLQQLSKTNPIDQDIDTLIDLNYKQHTDFALLQDVEYDFGKELIGGGWQRREVAMPEKHFFRWTNTHNSFIDFWMEPYDYTLSIRLINAVTLPHLDNLKITINNSGIDYSYDTDCGVVRILTAQISSTLITNNLLRIRFNHEQPLKHCDIFASNDDRNLGIAINWIKIKR